MLSLPNSNQKGVITLPILLAIVAIIIFLFISSYAPLRDVLFSSFYPKPSSHAAQNPPKYAPDTVLVKFKDNVSELEQEQILNENEGSKNGEIKQLKVKIVKVPNGKVEEKVEKLKNNPKVEYAEADYIGETTEIPNDSQYSTQWNMDKIAAPAAWDVTHGSNSVAIAVLDTGVNSNHEDLSAKIVKKMNFSSSSTVEDVHGHGTRATGIAGAITNNSLGVAGVCQNCVLYNVKVLNDDGTGTYSAFASGITWAADNGAKAISMSLGGSGGSNTLKNAVDYAWNKGVVVVAAAGNNGNTNPVYPAYYTNVISVAATDQNDVKQGFSTYGTWVDVASPSVVNSTCINGGYCGIGGTSSATPHVGGLAGLLAGQHPTWSNAQIREAIEKSADQISGTGTYWVNGRINASNAVQYVSQTPTPSATPTQTPSPTASPSSSPSENIPPVVSVTSPANGSTISRNSNFIINVTASDNVGVSKVEFYVDGGLKCTDTSSPYSCTTKISGKPGASHTIQAKAYDAAGNNSSGSVTVTAK